MTTVNRSRVKPLFFVLLTVVVILICHFQAHAPLCYGAQSKGIEVVIADAEGSRWEEEHYAFPRFAWERIGDYYDHPVSVFHHSPKINPRSGNGAQLLPQRYFMPR